MTLKQRLDYVFSLGRSGRYDDALREIAEIEKSGRIVPKLKIAKGRYIQLANDLDDYTLDDSEKCFREAIELDSDNPG